MTFWIKGIFPFLFFQAFFIFHPFVFFQFPIFLPVSLIFHKTLAQFRQHLGKSLLNAKITFLFVVKIWR